MHNLDTQTESQYIDGLLYITHPVKMSPTDKYWGNRPWQWNNILNTLDNNPRPIDKSNLKWFQTFIGMSIDSGLVYHSEWDSDSKTCNTTPSKLSDNQMTRLKNANDKINKRLESSDESYIALAMLVSIIFTLSVIALI